jgi:hypothetical protein
LRASATFLHAGLGDGPAEHRQCEGRAAVCLTPGDIRIINRAGLRTRASSALVRADRKSLTLPSSALVLRSRALGRDDTWVLVSEEGEVSFGEVSFVGVLKLSERVPSRRVTVTIGVPGLAAGRDTLRLAPGDPIRALARVRRAETSRRRDCLGHVPQNVWRTI